MSEAADAAAVAPPVSGTARLASEAQVDDASKKAEGAEEEELAPDTKKAKTDHNDKKRAAREAEYRDKVHAVIIRTFLGGRDTFNCECCHEDKKVADLWVNLAFNDQVCDPCSVKVQAEEKDHVRVHEEAPEGTPVCQGSCGYEQLTARVPRSGGREMLCYYCRHKCDRCGESMRVEPTAERLASDDGERLCDECHDADRTCCDCRDLGEAVLEKDEDGVPICDSCRDERMGEGSSHGELDESETSDLEELPDKEEAAAKKKAKAEKNKKAAAQLVEDLKQDAQRDAEKKKEKEEEKKRLEKERDAIVDAARAVRAAVAEATAASE